MSQPLFVRRLTRAERVNTKRLQRKPPSIDVGLRTQAVLLSRQGLTVREIGDIVWRNRSTVFRWLQGFDQRGVPRPQGDGCDIGSYELSQTSQ